ncbi:alpha/beta fold hydrolase [Lysinibacillus piscis]|uniref:Hydrolase n=1 Tax=Lysinibacillus piscis TaxID=2518931 RepID=A0ABQ5NLQ1_9BACI|nr:alpha/beta hydrolase [Lysinibacillus sp. KH24]GLC89281.1 hydrolase [Lysinibacillus sp. KH24]
MEYKEYGTAQPTIILFLHGGGVGGWMWDKQVRYFSHYHCIVPTLTDGVTTFSIEACAMTLAQLLTEKAQGKKVVVIGFSLGAQIAIKLMSIRPHSIDYAILNSALVIPSPLMVRMIRPMLRLTFPLIKNQTFARLQAKTLYIGADYFPQYYEDSQKITAATLTAILQENMSFTIPENFSTVTSKLLVTVGAKEKGVMKNSAKHLVQSHPNSQGVILPNIGHGISLAQPAIFNQFVADWLQTGQLPVGEVIGQ